MDELERSISGDAVGCAQGERREVGAVTYGEAGGDGDGEGGEDFLPGFIFAELAAEGERIEPSVSVPTAMAARLAAIAAPEPELEPEGDRSSA